MQTPVMPNALKHNCSSCGKAHFVSLLDGHLLSVEYLLKCSCGAGMLIVVMSINGTWQSATVALVTPDEGRQMAQERLERDRQWQCN